MNPRPIRFFHRGQIVEASGSAPTTSVLQWLREQQRATGTKEGCNEGDCGACTVLVGELDPDDRLRLAPVNSCIRFLPTLDGRALFTVEDLKTMAAARGQAQPPALHPVQEALVQCHGSQCGFCTPGFAMTLTASYLQHQAAGTRPSRPELADALAGNLCRCTGYRPILDAGERMFDLPACGMDEAPVVAALKSLRDAPALAYAAPGTAPFHAPRTLAELAALRAAHPQARLLAGGTDIGLWVNKQFRELGTVIWLGDVAELRTIATGPDGTLEIGAGATLEAAWTALAARHPELTEMWKRFAGPPVREAGTLGGNIANGSPIGDGAPVLIALGAQIVLHRAGSDRVMPLEDFYVDYMVNRLEPGEFVRALRVPALPAGTVVRAWKLSKRFDCDISGLSLGVQLRLAGGTAQDVRLAFGGMAAIVKRAAGAEAALRGQPWTATAVTAAMAALGTDFTPMSDLRASARYRQRAARNLLWRLWLETRPDAPLPAAALSLREVAA